jgi:predicted  nucleic acid-binding Zn-ribbon protein
MDVDAASLDRLLDLQTEDSAIRRLRERRDRLPEATRLEDVNARVAELTADREIARRQSDEIARDQARIEGEIEIIDSKVGREEQRMYSGSVANPKELSSLQSEVEMLKRQRSQAEDSLLEVMVRRETADATLKHIEDEHRQAEGLAAELTTEVTGLIAEIDSELSSHNAARDEIAPSISAQLLRTYEQIRDSKAGVGVAELVGGTCQGCHTKLPAVELERLERERGLQRCDNCRRILVIR